MVHSFRDLDQNLAMVLSYRKDCCMFFVAIAEGVVGLELVSGVVVGGELREVVGVELRELLGVVGEVCGVELRELFGVVGRVVVFSLGSNC